MTSPNSYAIGRRQFRFTRTYVMGIVNVTPDSFSDGGLYLDPGRAVAHALVLVEQGADILDIGGESTRPRGSVYGEGARDVSAGEELKRILPVISALAAATDVPISVDTTKAEVAREALSAGAVLVNDVSGFRMDPDMPSVIAKADAATVLMHMRGTPQTTGLDTRYTDLFGEIHQDLQKSIEVGRDAGIDHIIIDPGIGFGKDAAGNLRLLNGLEHFADLGCPILVGPSRKAFLGAVLGLPAEDRLEGTIAACVVAAVRGARFVRVHDVLAVKRALQVADAILTAEG
jgi:dihydropteroate synthase